MTFWVPGSAISLEDDVGDAFGEALDRLGAEQEDQAEKSDDDDPDRGADVARGERAYQEAAGEDGEDRDCPAGEQVAETGAGAGDVAGARAALQRLGHCGLGS